MSTRPIELKAFVKTITAEPRYNEEDGSYDHDNPRWKVNFDLSPYYDTRNRNAYSVAQVTYLQTIEVWYDDPPPFTAGEVIPWVIG